MPRLFLEVTNAVLLEGGATLVTVTREFYTNSDLVVFLSSSDPNQLIVPLSVTIPSNQVFTAFPIATVDNLLIEQTRSVSVSASAPGFSGMSADLVIVDNDAPELSLELLAGSVSEGAGSVATVGKVTRSFATALPLAVALESSNPGKAVAPATVTIPAGQSFAWFPIAAVDDAVTNAPVTVVISAFVTETFTGDRLGAGVSTNLTVLDNDGPTLTVDIPVDAVAAGTMVTGLVTRSGSLATPLDIGLVSSATNLATVPATLTIPYGQSSAPFNIATVPGSVTNGSRSVTITATAAGFTGGSAGLVVTDLLLPDLVVSNIVVPSGGEAGSTINVSYRVQNQGPRPLATVSMCACSCRAIHISATTPRLGRPTSLARCPSTGTSTNPCKYACHWR